MRHVRAAGISAEMLARYVRRRTAQGWPVGDVARWYGIGEARVRSILEGTSIKGPMARAVCRRHAAGEPPESIAEVLRLGAADVEAFLARRFPPPRATRPPREPRRYYEPREWGSSRGHEYRDEDPLVEHLDMSGPPMGAADPASPKPAIAAAEVPSGPSPAIAAAEDWGPLWDPAERPRGGRNGNAALSDDDARTIRELHAEGATRRELAGWFGVSMATVGRIVEGRTYRDAMPLPDVEEDDPPPVSAPVPTRWREPKRRGRAWRDD